MKTMMSLVLLLCCGLIPAQQKKEPEKAKPTPLSESFIRPATRAFTAIKESSGPVQSTDRPGPIDDRIRKAVAAASSPADNAFVAALKDYDRQKWLFNDIYYIKKYTAKVKVEIGGAEVPSW